MYVTKIPFGLARIMAQVEAPLATGGMTFRKWLFSGPKTGYNRPAARLGQTAVSLRDDPADQHLPAHLHLPSVGGDMDAQFGPLSGFLQRGAAGGQQTTHQSRNALGGRLFHTERGVDLNDGCSDECALDDACHAGIVAGFTAKSSQNFTDSVPVAGLPIAPVANPCDALPTFVGRTLTLLLSPLEILE